MHKVKSNAQWRGLSARQQETLDRWLFEEKLSYDDALTRAKNELGFKGSKASLQRYYVRRDKERTLAAFCDLRAEVAMVSGAPVDEKALRGASMKLLNEFLFRQLRKAPDKVKEWGMVASLIVDNDRNELMRELKGEELKLRQKAMDLARERFQFDTTKRALKALPELLELAEAKKDPGKRDFEENIRFNRATRAIFGPGLVYPESAKEMAEMLAAKREREARQEAESQRLRDRKELGGAQEPTPSSQYYEEYQTASAEWEAEARKWKKPSPECRKEAKEMSNEQGPNDETAKRRAGVSAKNVQCPRPKEDPSTKDQAPASASASISAEATAGRPEKLQTPAQTTNDQSGAPKPDETQKAAANDQGTKPGDQGPVTNTRVEERAAEPPPVKLKFTENGTSHDGTFRIIGRDKTG